MQMMLGAYTACLHDRELGEALEILASLGLSSAELNAGGLLPAPHVPVDALLASETARQDYLGRFADVGIALTALNVNGNPLHPDPEVRWKHAGDLYRAIELAGLLGVHHVITMSGNPGADSDSLLPSWVVAPWDSAYTEVLDYQWREVALPFWRDIDRRSCTLGVRVCVEMHPHNLVYNSATLIRLIESTGAENVGAELDPSHLFWQGIEPVAAIEHLGDRVFFAAAKDVRINEEHCRLNGVLDNRHCPPAAGEPIVSLGGHYILNQWPENPSWQFFAVGRGHEIAYWSEFLRALHKIDADMVVNVGHEDAELGQIEGLELAARNLEAAASHT